jgi:hypothetical protein
VFASRRTQVEAVRDADQLSWKSIHSARDGHSDRRSVGRGLVISQFRGTWKYGAFSAASTGRRGNPSADSRVAGASVFVQGLFGDQRAASHSDALFSSLDIKRPLCAQVSPF